LWFTSSGSDPHAQFEKGVALMSQPPGDDWLKARDEYFRPLIDADPAQWAEKAEPYLQRIANYESASDFWGRGRGLPRTEFQRFLNRARQYYQMGDTARAEQTLEALSALLAGREDQTALYDETRRILDELRQNRIGSADAYKLLHSSMEHAQALADQGKDDEARRVWSGVIELYDSDPAAKDEVERARQFLSRRVSSKP
jgi:hypothetical protein